MRDLLTVAKWEFTRNIRNKAFLVTTFLIPVLIIIAGVVPNLMADSKQEQLVVTDKSQVVYQSLSKILSNQDINVKQSDLSREELKLKAKEDTDASYLYIPENFLQTKEGDYYFQISSMVERSKVTMALQQIVKNYELKELGLTNKEIARLSQGVNIKGHAVDMEDKKGAEGIIIPIGFAVLFVITSMMSGTILLQSIITEKKDRVVEILLSSVSSRDIMSGKILGNSILGFIQMLIFAVIGFGVARFGFDMPIEKFLSFNLVYIIIYAILAYIFISVVYAFLGAIMKEVQSGGQAQPLLGILPVVPMWFAQAIITDPFGPLARAFSYIPPFTPVTMMLRVTIATVPIWEILGTMAILTLFNIFMIYFVARIFKTGLLMYGKTASFKEAWNWFKQATD